MSIKHKEIAEIVGVSIGTVDRALHNRGRIKPEVQQRVLDVARQYGYTPNVAGKALAKSKNPITIGIVLFQVSMSFTKVFLSGILKASSEITSLNGKVIIEETESASSEANIRAVDKLVEMGIDGLAICPTGNASSHNPLCDYLNELHRNRNLPIVTFAADIVGLERMFYVGPDNIRSGKTAAGLMNVLLGEKPGKVAVINGYASGIQNSQRVDGFIEEVANRYLGIDVVGIQLNKDDEESAYMIAKSFIEDNPTLAGIYMVSGGQAGACRALEETGKASQIKFIVHDVLPETVEYINKGVIDFIIDQNGFEQGYRSISLFFQYLFSNKEPELDCYFTDINIKNMHNL